MSRARHQATQNDVQLFPFVAVLLCTMGSLLVLLVIVTRSAKEHALQEAVVQQAAIQSAADARAVAKEHDAAAAQRELDRIAKYQAELDVVHAQAADRLRQDQQRLSHLEDHMRRLREQLDVLQLAAAELNAMEGEHFDDRQQAQHEIERLQQLIAESRSTIEQLRADAKTRARSFAIVPYQGKHGTFRRPIYIECRKNDIVIQPEGVVFTRDDFQPPIGPGNPLVAALRAAREHIAQYESDAATGNSAEPYPLIIVRPDGIDAYYYVREAIQSWDSEFGYELVEQDWTLQYAAANPQLATKEQRAADLARARLLALAAAAPQAYGSYRNGGSGSGNGFGGGFGGGFGSGGSGDDLDGDDAVGDDSDYEPADEAQPSGGSLRLAARPGDGRTLVLVDRSAVESQSGAAGGEPDRTGYTDDRYAAKQPPGQPTGTATSPSTSGEAATEKAADAAGESSEQGPKLVGQPSQQPPSVEQQADGKSAPGSYSAGEDPEQQLDNLARAAAASADEDSDEKHVAPKVRGKNWAIANGNPGMIPIRRSIQIVIRDEALALLPEATSTGEESAAGREFPIGDVPDAAYEDLISAVEKRIRDWGMAGHGLYWRPVVELKVSGGGDHRVDPLLRLLKDSGAEIRSGTVAQQGQGGASGTQR